MQDLALRNHVQLTVSGANGATGVLAPKLVELDLKKGTVKYHNKLSMEDKNALHGQMDKLMKQRSVQMYHVQLIANGVTGATGVLAPKLVELDLNKGLVLLLNKLSILASNVMEKNYKLSNVTIFHVQLIVNGANGATGVLAPKLVVLDLNKSLVLLLNKLSTLANNVMEKHYKLSNVTLFHVQLQLIHSAFLETPICKTLLMQVGQEDM